MPDFDWNIPLPLLFGHADSAPLHLSRALPYDPRRPAFEAFIQQRFRLAHGADIRHFMPQLFGVSQADGELCAVAGVRLARSEALFLEHYLDHPIEALVCAAAGQPVERRAIAEVGNLAASDNGSARLSIIAITWLLAMGGAGVGGLYRQCGAGQQLPSPWAQARDPVCRRPAALGR